MQFHEFNRRLRKCHIDTETKVLLSHMFETQVELSKQLDLTAMLIDRLVGSVKGFVQLHEDTQSKVKQLIRGGRPDGVEVHSVRNEPES
jgi:hypothetical protein